MPSTKTITPQRLASIFWICLPLITSAAPASEKMLFDFRSSIQPAPWQIVNDGVMGGLSTSQFRMTPNDSAVFSGVVSLENNGGFASVRSSPIREKAAGFEAFKIRVRGDGNRYKFTVRDGSGFATPGYQCSFNTKRGEWQEIQLRFEDFAPTFRGRALRGQPLLKLAKDSSLGFLISNKKAGPFQLEVGWIKVVKTKAHVTGRK